MQRFERFVKCKFLSSQRNNAIVFTEERLEEDCMFVGHIEDIEKTEINSPELKGVLKQAPIGSEQGWEDHVMRIFTLKAGGYTPKHTHPWPHINYVLKGTGSLYRGDGFTPIRAGSVAYIPNGVEHQFVNDSGDELSFICIVPKEGDV